MFSPVPNDAAVAKPIGIDLLFVIIVRESAKDEAFYDDRADSSDCMDRRQLVLEREGQRCCPANRSARQIGNRRLVIAGDAE